jgi:hypothetical protein
MAGKFSHGLVDGPADIRIAGPSATVNSERRTRSVWQGQRNAKAAKASNERFILFSYGAIESKDE